MIDFESSQAREEKVIETPGIRPVKIVRRDYILGLLLVAVTGLILGRGWQLQIIQGEKYQVRAEGNRVSFLPLPAARGLIFDSDGRQLVDNIASTDLVIDPGALPTEENETPLVEKLPALLEVEPGVVVEALRRARSEQKIIPVAKALPHEQVIVIEGELNNLPGVRLISSSVRKYEYAPAMSPVLGYTSPVTAEEIEARNDLGLTDITGKSGIEYQQDQLLRGVRGARLVEVNAAGQAQKEVGEEAAKKGADIYLTVDAELQQYIYDRLADRSIKIEEEGGERQAGAVVAIDPRSGAVRALVSYPAYDPNVFSQPFLKNEAGRYFRDDLRPLFNRAISGVYPPGSIIKPMLAAGGLQEGTISSSSTIESTGGINIGPWSFPDWKAGGHGTTNVTKAIAESVNTFFYLLVGGNETKAGMGVYKANEYLEQFGWGDKTGIDLPGEVKGLLPTPEWRQEVKGEKWYVGDTYHFSIGQGDVLATPLQVATATAGVANRGTIYRPYLMKAYQRPDQEKTAEPDDSRSVAIKQAYLDVVASGMRQAVTGGSARFLSQMSIDLAGKTGTAQIGGEDDLTHAWFTSFGPIEEPELVITVMLEKGGKGDVDAVPVAGDIWQWWVDHEED